jgi:hypothetical protein
MLMPMPMPCALRDGPTSVHAKLPANSWDGSSPNGYAARAMPRSSSAEMHRMGREAVAIVRKVMWEAAAAVRASEKARELRRTEMKRLAKKLRRSC